VDLLSKLALTVLLSLTAVSFVQKQAAADRHVSITIRLENGVGYDVSEIKFDGQTVRQQNSRDRIELTADDLKPGTDYTLVLTFVKSAYPPNFDPAKNCYAMICYDQRYLRLYGPAKFKEVGQPDNQYTTTSRIDYNSAASHHKRPVLNAGESKTFTVHTDDLPPLANISELRFGLPIVYYYESSVTFYQNIYAKGTGNGEYVVDCTINAQPIAHPIHGFANLASSDWTEIGTLTQPGSGKQIIKMVSEDDSSVQAAETLDMTGFIPALNGWPFGNYRDALISKQLGIHWYDDGVCLGMVSSSRYYYHHPPLPTWIERIMHNCIPHEQLYASNWYAAHDLPLLTGAREAVNSSEADKIAKNIATGDPTIIGLSPDQKRWKGHAVLGIGVCTGKNMFDDHGTKCPITNGTVFVTYDPNDTGNYNVIYYGESAGEARVYSSYKEYVNLEMISYESQGCTH
jgi:hypothetical protein